ncbi:hypothetical protein COV53_04315 [Candidatus Gottesmanbacteria bacterium CG11_big_fil_rev_8_21_14_0_20_37_11]|uniref:Uncharacterized protein n=3 Tax=Candidatus Gottesmaniibacteriota TaxID=1752720 RepID=A0A2M7RR68_9BACT|nr:MAG: hypothetical protein AUJ73_02960 [Candidatus Gottesmanbacteria bacterium CG1_02_37_22]PIP32768.1 MAG: hypothetical protein COX23_02990 [Candidatus Gottesmanbacteria bacterium CG23_combo_of_CG06-09_8_20_14_all_37_19]PIR08226.1 MAG: hypothetical protein COV53_04315 [Candidatus Gottesmanbacteria bacterium CG11_big_fil_rev_8_21_14_0_20_37_11]PIZ02474.1 MAG: hypothetical protein COY59_04705 [Candidatus Gottesmanbacteria bacterium CG_4_10_14_0_8_um_filter_37_24]
MKTDHFFHVIYYIFLTVILGLGVLFLYLYSGNPDRQFKVVILTSAFYFLMGVSYHKLKGDLHAKIVIEYLLIAIFSVILLRGAIY